MKAVSVLSLVTSLSCLGVCFSHQLECTPYSPKSNRSLAAALTSRRMEMVDPKLIVKFYLFTRENPDCAQELKLHDRHTLRSSNFNFVWPIRIVIHGWKNDLHSTIIDLIKSAYLLKGHYNVIAVDWGELAYNMNYDFVAQNGELIGDVVSEFILFLHRAAPIAARNKIYIIGHSLGAHIAGRAGSLSRKVHTIFALDPAEPYYKDLPEDKRIDPSDAEYVEVIHTDIGFLGYRDRLGHADFYPNYGKRQPGCGYTFKSCSHSRAFRYFAESINSKEGFWAIPCSGVDEIFQKKCTPSGSSALMGGEPSTPKTGIFYLPTNKKPLFAQGKFVPF